MTSTTFFFFFIPLLALILLAVNFLFAPHNPYEEKDSAFECGFHSFVGQNRSEFSVSFFLYGILFLVFDIEVTLVFPYVVSSFTNGGHGVAILLTFLVVLTIGFAFELGKGALKIDSKQTSPLNKTSDTAITAATLPLTSFMATFPLYDSDSEDENNQDKPLDKGKGIDKGKGVDRNNHDDCSQDGLEANAPNLDHLKDDKYRDMSDSTEKSIPSSSSVNSFQDDDGYCSDTDRGYYQKRMEALEDDANDIPVDMLRDYAKDSRIIDRTPEYMDRQGKEPQSFRDAWHHQRLCIGREYTKRVQDGTLRMKEGDEKYFVSRTPSPLPNNDLPNPSSDVGPSNSNVGPSNSNGNPSNSNVGPSNSNAGPSGYSDAGPSNWYIGYDEDYNDDSNNRPSYSNRASINAGSEENLGSFLSSNNKRKFVEESESSTQPIKTEFKQNTNEDTFKPEKSNTKPAETSNETSFSNFFIPDTSRELYPELSPESYESSEELEGSNESSEELEESNENTENIVESDKSEESSEELEESNESSENLGRYPEKSEQSEKRNLSRVMEDTSSSTEESPGNFKHIEELGIFSTLLEYISNLWLGNLELPGDSPMDFVIDKLDTEMPSYIDPED